jgi:hypothetical protein
LYNKVWGPNLGPIGVRALPLGARKKPHAHMRVGAFSSTAQLQLNELNFRTITYPPPLGHMR